MKSAGLAKVAIAFTVGIALALGGVGLYTRVAGRRTPVEQASAVAAVPEIAVPEMTAAESAMHADLAGTLPSSQAAEPSAAAAAATSSSSSAGSNG